MLCAPRFSALRLSFVSTCSDEAHYGDAVIAIASTFLCLSLARAFFCRDFQFCVGEGASGKAAAEPHHNRLMYAEWNERVRQFSILFFSPLCIATTIFTLTKLQLKTDLLVVYRRANDLWHHFGRM